MCVPVKSARTRAKTCTCTVRRRCPSSVDVVVAGAGGHAVSVVKTGANWFLRSVYHIRNDRNHYQAHANTMLWHFIAIHSAENCAHAWRLICAPSRLIQSYSTSVAVRSPAERRVCHPITRKQNARAIELAVTGKKAHACARASSVSHLLHINFHSSRAPSRRAHNYRVLCAATRTTERVIAALCSPASVMLSVGQSKCKQSHGPVQTPIGVASSFGDGDD